MQTNLSNHAHVAKLIRAEMKARGIKGTVRSKSYSGGCSVTVRIEDQAPEVAKSLDQFTKQFESGHFNGMTDCYEYTNHRSDIPQVKFVFVENVASDGMRANIWAYCRNHFNTVDQAPADLEAARNTYIPHWNCYAEDMVHRVFSGMWGEDFWKEKQAA